MHNQTVNHDVTGSSPVGGAIFRRHNGDIAHLTLVKSIPIYRGVFLFMPIYAGDICFIS